MHTLRPLPPRTARRTPAPAVRALILALCAGAAAPLTACGGPPKKVDTESIRRNADDADRDLDRESDKNKDD